MENLNLEILKVNDEMFKLFISKEQENGEILIAPNVSFRKIQEHENVNDLPSAVITKNNLKQIFEELKPIFISLGWIKNNNQDLKELEVKYEKDLLLARCKFFEELYEKERKMNK
jgi:hypothetical protein